ncbi:MAG: hypothetical protein M1825_004531 [Sarcosagium campestre]|nr:MAG: hypothetical protein M1825_004531 [Sarcosagium campestre]
MLDYLIATDDEVVEFCQKNRMQMIGGNRYGNIVLKISDEAVVKFGLGVNADEAANQQFAFERFNGGAVRIPRVFRFFQEKSGRKPVGYLIMEFVNGQSLTLVPQEKLSRIVKRIAGILRQFGQVTSDMPGPMEGGEPQGYLWSESGARTTFKTVKDMEAWLNKRLAISGDSIDLGSRRLCFCHLDLARRNLLQCEDDSICLLDWASAGFYPRVFEICCIHLLVSSDRVFFELLLHEIGNHLVRTDEHLLHLLLKAYSISQRFDFGDLSDETNAIMARIPPGPPPLLPQIPRSTP